MSTKSISEPIQNHDQVIINMSASCNEQVVLQQPMGFCGRLWDAFCCFTRAMRMDDAIEPIVETAPFSAAAHAAEYEERYETDVAIMNQTLTLRLKKEQVGIQEEGNADLVIAFTLNESEGEQEPHITAKYLVSAAHLRGAPASTSVKATMGAVMIGLTGLSYFTAGQGIMTKECVSALVPLALDFFKNFPYVPQVVTPIGIFAASYVIEVISNHPLSTFAGVLSLALIAGIYRRMGKGVATGGWSSAKPFLISAPITETGIRALGRRIICCCKKDTQEVRDADAEDKIRRIVARIPVTPLDPNAEPLAYDVTIELSSYDKDMWYRICVGNVQGEWISMAAGREIIDDDDDDQDDDKKVEKKDKKKDLSTEKSWPCFVPRCFRTCLPVPDWLESQIKEGTLFIGSGIATAISLRLWNEGLITVAANDIHKASTKAAMRLWPIGNAYGILALTSGALILVNVLTDSFIGELYFMPLSILGSMAIKQVVKDAILTGKPPKNDQIFAMPIALQQLRHRLTGWVPAPNPPGKENPLLHSVLEKRNQQPLRINIDPRTISSRNDEGTMIPLKIKISGRKLKGTFEVTSEQESLTLLRAKAEKLSPLAEGAYNATCIGFTYAFAALFGQGVVANIFNKAFTTYMKQTGKDLTPVQRSGGSIVVCGITLSIDHFVLEPHKIDFQLSMVPVSAALTMLSKQAKMWTNGKPYSKGNAWIWKGEDKAWDVLKTTAKKVFCCKREELAGALMEVDDNAMITMTSLNEDVLEVMIHSDG